MAVGLQPIKGGFIQRLAQNWEKIKYDKLTLMRAATVPSHSTGLILAVRFVLFFITEVTIL
jgi:hypothetical protein